MAEEQKEEVKIVLNKYDKKQLKWNIIKFVIWLILLALSRWYIQKHPAEKVSVFSGFDVLWQKIEIFFQNTFKGNWKLLEQKYSVEKWYKELVSMAEWNSCVSTEEYSEIEKAYENLKNESNDTLNDVLPEYIRQGYEFEDKVKNDSCEN